MPSKLGKTFLSGLKTKAAVSALSSLYGPNTGGLTRPVPSTFWGGLMEPFAGAWQQGRATVDSLSCITAFGAVFACISRISNDIAKLQPRLMQQQADGTWIPAPSNSPHWIPLRKPNGFQNRIQFFTHWLNCKLLYGNVYALKVRDGREMVSTLYLLDPRRVTPLVTPDGSVYYSLGGDDLSRIPEGMVIPASEIIHDRYQTLWHPLVGVSPIYACAISSTQGNKIQSNSSKFFENMSRPSGVLSTADTISDETAARLKAEFQKNFAGSNIGNLLVAGDGLKYEPMTIPANDAQLIDQLKWTVEDVARAFCMPLYKIGAGPMPTNNNVGDLNQQYYDDCLQVHIEAIELCLDEGLSVPPASGVEFDLEGLLRMNQAMQIEMLANSVKGTIRTPNEARGKLNLPPKTGGDAIYMQVQNYSLEALAKRDAREDPFAKGESSQPPAPPAPPPAASAAAADEEPEKAASLQRAQELLAEKMQAQSADIDRKLEESAQSLKTTLEETLERFKPDEKAQKAISDSLIKTMQALSDETDRKVMESTKATQDAIEKMLERQPVVPVVEAEDNEALACKAYETLAKHLIDRFASETVCG